MDSYMDNVTTGLTNTTEKHDFTWCLPTALSMSLLGLPTNALVIRLLLGKPGICSTVELFTLNLAMSNLLFCITFPIEYTYLLFSWSLTAGDFLSWGMNQVSGPLLLCLICLDSYLAVCHPLLFLRLKAPKLRMSLCVAVSVLASAFCTSLIFWRSHKWKVILTLVIGAMVNTSTCNILVLRSLCQSGPSRNEMHPVKKRAFKAVLTVFVLINIHYVPPMVDFLLRISSPKSYPGIDSIHYMSFSMGSFTQPLWYLIQTKQLPKMKCHCGSVHD